MHLQASRAADEKENHGLSTPGLYQLFLNYSEDFVASASAAEAKLLSKLEDIAVSAPCSEACRPRSPSRHCASHLDICTDMRGRCRLL